MPERPFFSLPFLLAGAAFRRFSELCHPEKGTTTHAQSWPGDSGAGSPARGDQLLPAPAKAFFRHQRKLTRHLAVFSFFFTEAAQWLTCKISPRPACTGADAHEKGLT